jgi:glycosyltransferase involved in cell wall biosynthesis
LQPRNDELVVSDIPSSLSLRHRAWRLLPAQGRRRLAVSAAALLAPRPAKPVPAVSGGIVVVGEFTRASGLGEGARLMLSALKRLGVPCWGLDIGHLLPAHRDDLPASVPVEPAAGAAIVLHVNAPLLPIVLLRLPRKLMQQRRIIGYWAWELPELPADWRVGARFVHEAWVPSRFTATAAESVLPRRVRVVPHPVATAPPVPAPPDRAAFGLPPDAVVVLTAANLASSFARKNPLAAVAAFRAAFGARPDRVLILKLGNPDHFPSDFAQVRSAVAGAPNIRLETRTLPTGESNALTAAADIVLSLHRSEGFGLVLAEAMLLGKPAVATGWSGNMEFMDETNSLLVPFHLIPARDSRGVYDLPDTMWAEPDIGAASMMLTRLADDPALREALGKRAKVSAAEKLGLASLAAGVRALGLHVGAE